MNAHQQQLQDRLKRRAAVLMDAREPEYRSRPGHDTAWPWEVWRENHLGRIEAVIEVWAQQVPPLWSRADVTALTANQSPALVRDYLAGEARNLILSGPVGTGKSYTAWAVAHEEAARGVRCKAWSVPRLLLDMRPGQDEMAFDAACTVPVLLLDDLGASRPTDWATEQIYSIAEARTSGQLRTVVTTNQTWSDLVNLWGEPTMDRLRDDAVALEMIGDSRRGAA